MIFVHLQSSAEPSILWLPNFCERPFDATPKCGAWSSGRHLAGVTSVRSADGDDFAPELMIWAVFPAGMTSHLKFQSL